MFPALLAIDTALRFKLFMQLDNFHPPLPQIAREVTEGRIHLPNTALPSVAHMVASTLIADGMDAKSISLDAICERIPRKFRDRYTLVAWQARVADALQQQVDDGHYQVDDSAGQGWQNLR